MKQWGGVVHLFPIILFLFLHVGVYGRVREVYLPVLRCPVLIGFDLLPWNRAELYCTWCIKWRGKMYTTDKLCKLEYCPFSEAGLIAPLSQISL
jgi:hypothetical protein